MNSVFSLLGIAVFLTWRLLRPSFSAVGHAITLMIGFWAIAVSLWAAGLDKLAAISFAAGMISAIWIVAHKGWLKPFTWPYRKFTRMKQALEEGEISIRAFRPQTSARTMLVEVENGTLSDFHNVDLFLADCRKWSAERNAFYESRPDENVPALMATIGTLKAGTPDRSVVLFRNLEQRFCFNIESANPPLHGEGTYRAEILAKCGTKEFPPQRIHFEWFPDRPVRVIDDPSKGGTAA